MANVQSQGHLEFAMKARRKDVMKKNKLSSCSAKHCDCLTALNCNAIHYADADYDRGKEGGRDGAMEGKQEEEKGYEDPAGSDY
jgi:hypothetical protein